MIIYRSRQIPGYGQPRIKTSSCKSLSGRREEGSYCNRFPKGNLPEADPSHEL